MLTSSKIIVLFLTISSSICWAEGNQKNKTIPFVYETTTLANAGQAIEDFPGKVNMEYPTGMMNGNSTKNSPKVSKTTTNTASVEVDKVSNLVSSIHDSICAEIKKGSIRVWLKFDANAKILGIGTSSEGGIEVMINCG